MQSDYEEFEMVEISLVNYNANDFTLLINDHRVDRDYVTTVFINGEEQFTQILKNGSNTLNYNGGLGDKVFIEIYDPDNEFNGYGFKNKPWSLMFVVD